MALHMEEGIGNRKSEDGGMSCGREKRPRARWGARGLRGGGKTEGPANPQENYPARGGCMHASKCERREGRPGLKDRKSKKIPLGPLRRGEDSRAKISGTDRSARKVKKKEGGEAALEV